MGFTLSIEKNFTKRIGKGNVMRKLRKLVQKLDLFISQIDHTSTNPENSQVHS